MSDLMVPSRSRLAEIHRDMKHAQEKARMDFLSDPKNVFGYSIRADGTCVVRNPVSMHAKSLRDAIDYLLENPEKQIRK